MNSKIIKNYIYNLLNIFMTILFPILFFPYVSRILKPEYYGKYNFTLSIVSYFLILAEFGIQSYGIKELIASKIKSEKIFKRKITELILIGFLMSIISFTFYMFLIIYNKILAKDKILFIFTGLPILFSFLILDYFFIAIENYKRRTIRLLLIKSISLILIFLFIKKPEDYILFSIIIVIPELIARGIDFYMIKKYLCFKNLKLKKYIKPLSIIFLYTLSTNICLNIDSTMLGLLKGDSEVGYYSVSIKMVKIIIPITTSLGIVLSNNIIENIKKNNYFEIYNLINFYTSFIFFLSIPAILLLFLLKKEIILLFSGNNYLNSISPMSIMLPIIYFISMSRFYATQILLPLNKEKLIFKVSIIGLSSNFILNIILIPKYSIIGAAFATLISEFIVYNFRLLEIKRIFSTYNIFIKDRIFYILASIVSFTICFILKFIKLFTNMYIEIIVITLTFGFIYFICLLLCKEYFLNMFFEKIKFYCKRKR